MRGTAGEVQTNLKVKFFYRLLHMDIPVLIDQQRFIYISSVRRVDAVQKTNQERWMIGTDGERCSWNSMLLARVERENDFPNKSIIRGVIC